MNVTVETLAPCKRLMRFEVDAKAVEDAFAATTKEYAKQAKMPGFRPGKAPEAMVARQYQKDIEEEVKRRLIGDSYRQGIKDQKLAVLGYPDIEEIQFTRGQALQFAATVEITPEFELPEYRGLAAKREPATVTDEDLTRALDALREQAGSFEKIDRAVQENDYVVVNYTGTSEGKPLTEIAPTAKGLTEHKNFWVEVKPTSFIPGFAMQLIGANAGEKRAVQIDFPADFVTPELAGKKATYDVEVVEVKVKKLPELDDAFAKTYGTDSVDKLREGVRQDLQNERNHRQRNSIRNQIVNTLVETIPFDVPESTLADETRSVVYGMVQENQRRGVPKELIENQKDQIFIAAQSVARGRVKMGFIFQKIAEKEGIRAENDEMSARITMLAQSAQMPPKKYLEELQKREALPEVYQSLVHEKVLDFLQGVAKIEDVPAGSLGKAQG